MRKQETAETDKINRVIHKALRSMRAPEDLTLCEWADKYLMLSPESSAEPGHYRSSRTPYIKEVMDSLVDGTFSSDKDQFRMIFDEIMYRNDEFMVLKDMDSYLLGCEKIESWYKDRDAWGKKCLINVAKSGWFSSDRTISEYNRDIWHLKKLH